MSTGTGVIDWPAEFAAGVLDLGGLDWREVRPGCWQAPYEGDQVAVAVTTPTDRLWAAAILLRSTMDLAADRIWFTYHDGLAERLRSAGWTVGCAADGCAYTWPCPTREMHDFMSAPNGGELHTPIGLERKAVDG